MTTLLRAAGLLLTALTGAQALTPVGDCGTVIRPDTVGPLSACDATLASRTDSVLLLGAAAVLLLIAGQLAAYLHRV